MLQPLDVIVLRGNLYNPMTYVIMQRTSSRWTHAVTYKGSGQVYDARMSGVCINKLDHYKGRRCAVLRYGNEIPHQRKIAMLLWLDKLAKESRPYDYAALLGFLTGVKAFEDEHSWYCSEIPYWMFEEFQMPLFNGEKTFIYPSDLYRCNDFKIVYEGNV